MSEGEGVGSATKISIAPHSGPDERDPDGKDPHAGGAKLDAGKPMVGLMMKDFARALMAVAEIATEGAVKYTPSGWEDVPDARNRYEDAMGRHLLEKYIAGDSAVGLKHHAQEAWNALITLELRLREAEQALEDDFRHAR